ncbi:Bifunctional protein ThiO/ThiG [Dietzia timorensis]|uniref:Bifunctional protein ThiO/ThiG n=1 Tax=Dietzia timorensis TaxID=499555 RepID=A0A173LPI7_9ACTN|nr:Bifunctional protein ThiO/ThiG [Dietzia timorensis]
MAEARKVAVVGGSVIGLTIAFRAARAGFEVTVFDPDDSGPAGVPSRSAAWVAGGMLAPYSEAWPGEPEALHLGLEALAAWPALLEELAEYEKGTPGGEGAAGDADPWTRGRILTSTGCLLLGCDDADTRDLNLALDWALETTGREPQSGADTVDPATLGEAADQPVVRITRRHMRALEPGLTGQIRSAYYMPGEGSIDNRRLLGALRRGAAAEGGMFVRRRIDALGDLAGEGFDAIVIAAGEGSTRLTKLPVRNVKGEVLRIFERPGCEPAPTHVVRAQVRGRPLYLVPRDGGLVVGATQYEHGEDRQVTVAGVRDLLADAETVFPAIGEYELRETIAGLRPMSADNLPYIGPIPQELLRSGESVAPLVIAATGHGRNGVALSSVTAEAILAYLEGGADAVVSEAVAAAHPARMMRGEKGREGK